MVCYGAGAIVGDVWELKREGASTEQALMQLGVDEKVAGLVSGYWAREIEEPVWLALDSVQAGVMDVLRAMRGAGARLWLITARSRREWVPQQLARLGLSPWLDQVTLVSAHEAARAKTAVLRQASAAAFFGDTESDWRASLTAEVPFYAVASGQRSAAFLARAGVGVVHRDLAAAWEASLARLERQSNS